VILQMTILRMTEEEWLLRKNVYRQRLATIVIPLDITPGVAKGILSRIDAFFSEARIELGEVQGQKERIDNIIREWERTKATGTNEAVRRKNAAEALQEYPIDETTTVNLYEWQRMVYDRYFFLDSIVDTLNGKQSRLITVAGLLKLEKDLAPYAAID
jgi:hypothetical protein